MLIKGAFVNDTGDYACKAENDMGNSMDTLSLRVDPSTTNETKSYS